MLESIKIIYRTFVLNDFFSTIASSWSSATIFLTITAGFSAGVLGLATEIAPLAFVPPLLATLSPYLITFTVLVGIASYVASLFNTYTNEKIKYETTFKNRLSDIMDEQELLASKETVSTTSKLYSNLCKAVQKHLINDYQVKTGYLIGRSDDRKNRILKIQLTKRLLDISNKDSNIIQSGKYNSENKASILSGCIVHQMEGAKIQHKTHSLWAAYFTKSDFVNACKNTLKDNQVRQQDKNNYLKFFNEKKHYYKNIEDNKLFIDRLNNLEVIGTVYSP